MATNNSWNVATGSLGTILRGQGVGTAPAFTVATYPNTTNINEILYSNAANTVTGIPISNQSVLTSNTSGVPAWTPIALNGQLIIGSTAGSPAAATLTAGSGISITNGSNSITISATGGTVQTFTYISTVTASGLTNLDFTSLDNTYKSYRFCFNTLASGGSFQIKASTDNLSTFATLDMTYEKFAGGTPQVISYITSSSTAVTIASLTSYAGFMDIANIGEATKQIMLSWNISSTSTATNATATHGTGQDDTREAINSIRFLCTSGTFSAGTITLYGIS